MGQQQPESDMTALKKPDGPTLMLAFALAAPSWPLMALRMGKNHPNTLLIPGGLVLLAWIVLFPQEQDAITAFALVWLVALAIQKLAATWSHYYGRRQHTDYLGFPIISYVIGHEKFARRWVNPVALFYLADFAGNPAITLLLKASSVGQVVVLYYVARITRADADGRDNAQWEARNR